MGEFCGWVQPGFHKAKEAKYKNKELSEVGGKRPIGLNSLTNSITRPDLLSRLFAPVTEQNDTEVDKELILTSFLESKPVLLGYALGIISKFLYHYDTMKEKIKVRREERLKRFDIACEVLSRCLGNEDGAYQNAWAMNAGDQTEAAIENSSLSKVLIVWCDKADRKYIEKQPHELMKELEYEATSLGYDIKKDRTFPKGAPLLTKYLNYLAVPLSKKGIVVKTREKDSAGRRIISIENKNVVDPKKDAMSLFDEYCRKNNVTSMTLPAFQADLLCITNDTGKARMVIQELMKEGKLKENDDGKLIRGEAKLPETQTTSPRPADK
jgi:hypothetical protein